VFDGRDFLTLAEELATRTADESAMRTAVSRAYYAAFLVARGAMRPGDVGVKHKQLWGSLRDAPERERRVIAETGNRLYRQREEADYGREVANLSREVALALARSREVVNTLDNLA